MKIKSDFKESIKPLADLIISSMDKDRDDDDEILTESDVNDLIDDKLSNCSVTFDTY